MNLFIEFSLIIVLATLIAGLMRLLKQPLIVGHILTGLIVGPLVLGFVEPSETLEIFSEFGVAILLFIVGLHLSPNVAREVGKVSIIAGAGQILLTAGFAFLLSTLFGYSTTSSLYIAVAMTFSSTIIVLKLLADRKDLEKLYAKIAIGILLVQDVVATSALIYVSTFSNGESAVSSLGLLLLKGLALTIVLVIVSMKILPKLGDFFATSQEFLFLFAIGWGFGLASLFSYVGFSIEIGALVAGVALSVSPYSQEISSKLKSLRDFFIIMFFVFLGAEMTLTNISSLLLPAIVLSIFAMVLKPAIIIVLTSALRYKKKTSFMAGVSLAQISEFSLILAFLGREVGHIDNEVLSLITLVAVLTIAISTYIVKYSEKIFPHVSKYISIVERKKTVEEFDILNSYDVVLFGSNRVGYDFLKLFRKFGQSFLVVDFDPLTVRDLKKEGINVRYGDAEDAELLDELNLGKSKMIVSTIPDFDTNEFLVEKIKKMNDKVVTILMSYNIDEALKLYKKGADYVILPHFISGHFAAMLAAKHWFDIKKFGEERERHMEYLNERKALGHKHPKEN